MSGLKNGADLLRTRIWVLSAVLVFAALAAGCGASDAVQEAVQGEFSDSCVEGDPYYYLVDGSTSVDSGDRLAEQLDGLAQTITEALEECTTLTVARFGGSLAELDVAPVHDLKPSGYNQEAQADEAASLAADALTELTPILEGEARSESSDPIGAISWACREMSGAGTITVATDGLMTTPQDVVSPDFDNAAASESGAEIAAQLPAECESIRLEVVGLGRTKPSTEPGPSAEYVETLELFWDTIVAGGGFSEGSDAMAVDSSWAGAAAEIAERRDELEENR